MSRSMRRKTTNWIQLAQMQWQSLVKSVNESSAPLLPELLTACK
jgi:hypothetical protein